MVTFLVRCDRCGWADGGTHDDIRLISTQFESHRKECKPGESPGFFMPEDSEVDE